MRTRRAELLAVGALFVVTGAYLAIQAARVDSYIWLVDELLYTKAALGIGHELGGHVFGLSFPLPNGLYPWLLAAPYKAVSNIHAFRAAHVLDALVYASTLIPVYVTARLMGARRAYALVGAALARCVPWAVAPTRLMTQ